MDQNWMHDNTSVFGCGNDLQRPKTSEAGAKIIRFAASFGFAVFLSPRLEKNLADSQMAFKAGAVYDIVSDSGACFTQHGPGRGLLYSHGLQPQSKQ